MSNTAQVADAAPSDQQQQAPVEVPTVSCFEFGTAPKSGNILQGFCPTGKGLQACEWSPQHVENVTKKTAKFSVLFN
eukprot:PRCOL_00002546-RA